MARIPALLFFIIVFGFAFSAPAQIPLGQGDSLKVVSESEGLLFLQVPAKLKKFSPFVVFVRAGADEFEIIARGKVETIQGDKVLVTLDKESVIKYPTKGDLAVPMGAPKDWPQDGDPNVIMPSLSAEPDDLPGDPGYIELDYGLFSGKLLTTATDNVTNEYKDLPKYAPTSMRFAWYFEFLWRLGVEYETWSGSFDTSTYNHDTGKSSDSVTNFHLNYRFRRQWLRERLRPILRIATTSASFTTLNQDEYLLSTDVSGFGVGGRLSYEFDSLVWKPKSGSGFKFLQAFADLNYFPSVTANDTGIVQRGSAGKGTQMDWKVGISAAMYLKSVPLIKRYIVQVGYFESSRTLSFSGPTVSDVGYTIPENTGSTEKYQIVFATIGVRFEDVIGAFLKPR